jgi:hypothetical protein
LLKATINFVMFFLLPVCLFVRVEKLFPHWTKFDEIWYVSFSRKYAEKIKFLLKSEKHNGYFTRRRFHIYDNISLNFS